MDKGTLGSLLRDIDVMFINKGVLSTNIDTYRIEAYFSKVCLLEMSSPEPVLSDFT